MSPDAIADSSRRIRGDSRERIDCMDACNVRVTCDLRRKTTSVRSGRLLGFGPVAGPGG